MEAAANNTGRDAGLLIWFRKASRHANPEADGLVQAATVWGRIPNRTRRIAQVECGQLVALHRRARPMIAWIAQIYVFELAAEAAHVSIHMREKYAAYSRSNWVADPRYTREVGSFVRVARRQAFGVPRNDAMPV